MLTLISIIFGALVGSFLNVCIVRLPKEESIITPGSHCPHCKKPIKFYDNIPLVSYLLLMGKCRYCKKTISPQYPLVEGITALSSLFLFMRFGPSLSYLIYFAFVAALIIIIVLKGKDFKYAIPFGPFLSLGAVISLFYGNHIINWYLYINR